MTFSEIAVGRTGRIATLTLNRPERRNPISGPAVIAELVSALEAVQADPEVSVLVLTGAGSCFSAGGDIRAMRERSETFAGAPLEVARNYRSGVQRIPLAFEALDVPVIAAVNGPAVGAGSDLAMMCDLRIASTAARFSQAFVNLGIVPGDGGAWFLTRRIGYQHAADLILTGRTVEADEALALGMVMKVVPPEALTGEAMALAEIIAAKPPQAVRLAKRLLRQAERVGLADFLDATAAYQAMLHHTEDHREAVAATLDKRPPQFTGR